MIKTLELHNDVQEVALLTEWVEQIGEEWALPMSSVFQLNLALEEAVVNVMNYAFPAKEVHSFTITADTEIDGNPETMQFSLVDDGVPFDPTQQEAPDVTLSAEERQIGGLGIFLVEQFMETTVYKRENDRNILTMVYRKEKNK